MLSSFNILSEENASVPQLKQNQDKKNRKVLGSLSVNRVSSHRGLSTPAGKLSVTGGSNSVSVVKPQTAVKFKVAEAHDPKEMVCSGAGSVVKEDLFAAEFRRTKGENRSISVLNEFRDVSNIVKYNSKENASAKSLDSSMDIADDLSALADNIFDSI